jgi:hypothetical protein
MNVKNVLTVLSFGLLSLLATNSIAQEKILPLSRTVNVELTDGQRKWWAPLPVTKRTADFAFWESTAESFAATVADGENTMHVLNNHKGNRETNFLYGNHPDRLRYYGIALPLAGACAYYSWKWKREDQALKDSGYPGHRFAKWRVPNAYNTGSHVFGLVFTLLNARY